jgi:HSP20 family protein
MERKCRGEICLESWGSDVQWSRFGKTWRPPTDVYETDLSIVIKVELAGMSDDKFRIDFEGPNLIIAGTRRDVTLKLKYRQMEIVCGEFLTSIRIEDIVDKDGVTASYSDGFLVVVLPKTSPLGR